jgi:2-methylisocitrate lyase-like PEP mutase family enzyme
MNNKLKPKNYNYGSLMRERIKRNDVLSLIGVYDVFSSILSAQKFEAIFCSGYGFSASYYGLPDEGFIAWTDMVSYVKRIRGVLKETHIVVDIDDGHGDHNVAAIFAKRLEQVGASAVILEDQRRPKQCGHLPGKEIVSLDDYMTKLEAVLNVRDSLFVIARTDSTDLEESIYRAKEFTRAGADGILVEGLTNIEDIAKIREAVGEKVSVVVNLIAGGKTPPVTLNKLSKLGANIVNYSTPCLFSAQKAIESSLDQLLSCDGELKHNKGEVSLLANNKLLKDVLVSTLKG